jgi:radical SAM superfamily enzyme YgiQ (UPF0313 family)
MAKPKLQIIVLYQNLGDEHAYFARPPAPPLSGILLAGLTPDIVEVEVLHEMVRPIDYETDADFIALSFMDFCAPHAYEVARRFRRLGKPVVAGGKYPSTFPHEVAPHVDAVVVGEAERIWDRVVRDMVAGRLQRMYSAPIAPPLDGIPPPRYDLVETTYPVPVVTEATRGCPFRCSYCQLNIRRTAHRCRPIPDVIRDLRATGGLSWRRRKLAMLYDNNLGGDLDYARRLLREIAQLDHWALGVQFTFNCLDDREFLNLLADARCRMAFIGLESLNEPSLRSVRKRQNKVEQYEEKFLELKERGILTFTGMMLALDEDTPSYYRTLPDQLERVDPSAIFLSIGIPIHGTPFHREVEAQGRIFDRNLAHYEGDHLVYLPRKVTPAQVFETRARLMRSFYSWKNIARRWWRFMSAYWRGRVARGRAFGTLLISYILVELSAFQRHHAKMRVFPAKVPRVSNARSSAVVVGPGLRTAAGGRLPAAGCG